MRDFSFISDTIKEKLRECGVFVFSFKGNTKEIVHYDGGTMSLRHTLTDKFAHPQAHGHAR